MIAPPVSDRDCGGSPFACWKLPIVIRRPPVWRFTSKTGATWTSKVACLPVSVRDALQQIVASGKADGAVRTGPVELWAGVWLAVVAGRPSE
jgi:hypothetical protein